MRSHVRWVLGLRRWRQRTHPPLIVFARWLERTRPVMLRAARNRAVQPSALGVDLRGA